MPSWCVIGGGYTGARVAAAAAARGDDVVISRRTAVAAAATAAELGVRGVAIELAQPATLAGAIADGAIVVCCAPPGDDPAAEMRALIAAAARARRLIYVSSTAVYGRGDGGWVDEDAPLAPITAAGRARVIAEATLAAHASAIALRAAGIYGPGRGMIERLRAGAYRVIGDGRSHVSRIHVDDLVAAILAAATRDVTGAINIADDDPAPIGDVADAVADAIGVPRPPRVAAESVGAELAGMLTADRRIANMRMKRALGVTLAHPSWRALIA